MIDVIVDIETIFFSFFKGWLCLSSYIFTLKASCTCYSSVTMEEGILCVNDLLN